MAALFWGADYFIENYQSKLPPRDIDKVIQQHGPLFEEYRSCIKEYQYTGDRILIRFPFLQQRPPNSCIPRKNPQ